jgi:hypothetical protein
MPNYPGSYPQPLYGPYNPPPIQNSNPNRPKWRFRDWLVKVIIPILGVIASAGFFTAKDATSTSKPTIPHLHQSYTGHLTSAGKPSSLIIASVSENLQTGDFTATGTDPCPVTLSSGKANSDNSVSFELRESFVQGTQCGWTGEFKGNIRSDGSMMGTWDVPNTQFQGGWDLS